MYGGKFAFQKLSELACSGKEICHFCFVLLCIRGQIPSTSPPGGLIFGGAYFRNFMVYITIIWFATQTFDGFYKRKMNTKTR